MDYKKARRIWRNNFPDVLKKGFSIMGNVSHKKYTMPSFESDKFRKTAIREIQKLEQELQNADAQPQGQQ